MNVNIIDLKQRYLEERDDILSIIDKTLASGSLVMTPEINDFEKDICKFVNSKNCSTLNSGTDALMMGLWALGVKKGDEVITSPVSFIASAGAIYHLGAKPVFVDVSDDLNINPELIEILDFQEISLNNFLVLGKYFNCSSFLIGTVPNSG